MRAFARSIGIAEGTLRTLLRGGGPSLETLVAIARTQNVEIAWLALGEGPMRTGPVNRAPRTPAPTVDAAILRDLSRIVVDLHSEARIRLATEAQATEVAAAYNQLLERAEDPFDRDELESLLPWLAARLRKRLKAAREDPGTGKRSA